MENYSDFAQSFTFSPFVLPNSWASEWFSSDNFQLQESDTIYG